MSEKDIDALAGNHPNLYESFVRGTLMEPNPDFVEVAKQYPVDESS
jgi:hypothetical protein